MAGSDPYVGLRPYDIGDRDLFYGRDHESRDVSELWQSSRLVVLHGSSGVGKTSLVQAGVIPRFDREAIDVLPVARVSRGFTFPMAALPKHNPYTLALLSSWSPAGSLTSLVDLSVTEFLRRRIALAERHGDPKLIMAAIDQFEELFSDLPYRQHYVEEFIDQLTEAADVLPTLRLLISIREGGFESFFPYETKLAQDSGSRFRLLPLPRDGALEAVRGPLVGTGRLFAPEVAEKLVESLLTAEIVSHAGETTRVVADTVEPVQLQVVCAALWRALPEKSGIITAEHLRYRGDVDSILTEFCAQMVSEVAAEHDVPERALHEWLERTFITELGTRGEAYEGLSAIDGMSGAIARALEHRHILKFGQHSGTRWYQLQNDRIIEPIRRANRCQLTSREIVNKNPDDYIRAAEDDVASGELKLAEKHAQEALRLCGERDTRTRAEAELLLGNIAFQGERLKDAESHYRRAAEYFEILQDQASVGRLLAAIGQLSLARGSYSDAIDKLQAAVTRLQGDLTMQVELARALWSSGQPRAADAVLGSVLTIAPDAAEALAGRGQIRLELNDLTSALEDLANLSRLRPDIGRRADVRAARALTLARLGKIKEAKAEADAALQGAPDSGPVLLRASGVARVAGGPQDADALLRRARDAQDPALAPHQLAEVRRLLDEPLEGSEA
ncbi:MAG: tetratricopeptide repeat protein [Actinomycetota bacterium]|nr:tetratricopeptide repeat protein [Actinomycetota bacterium]